MSTNATKKLRHLMGAMNNLHAVHALTSDPIERARILALHGEVARMLRPAVEAQEAEDDEMIYRVEPAVVS